MCAGAHCSWLSYSAQMIQSLGWPSVFFGDGSLGIVWYTFWQVREAETGG